MSAWLIMVMAGAAVVAIGGISAVATHNKLVRLRNRVDNAWSQVEIQLQRRYDLVPNLVETVRGHADHESTALAALAQARAAVGAAATPEAKAAAEDELACALRGTFARAEATPELKASDSFRQLQSQLADTEDKISYMRLSYNDTVMAYNSAIQTFPGILFAGTFEPRRLLYADDGALLAPRVSL